MHIGCDARPFRLYYRRLERENKNAKYSQVLIQAIPVCITKELKMVMQFDASRNAVIMYKCMLGAVLYIVQK